MPLGLSDNLFRRIVSALSLLPVVLGVIYLGGWWFAAFLALGAVLMIVEWGQLVDISRPQIVVSGILVVSFLAGAQTVADALYTNPDLAARILASFIIILVIVRPAVILNRPGFRALVGIAYVGMAVVSLAWLRALDENGLLLVWLFFAVWAMDVGGYFAGKGIGGPKLAPKISPKKTWAGFIGGILLSALVGGVIAYLFDWIPVKFAASGAAAIAVVAQMGDLYESAVKRHFDVKDSGTLIPGHGGILDRVDGLIFAAPIAAIMMIGHRLILGTGS